MRRTLLLLLWILAIPAALPAQSEHLLEDDARFHTAPEATFLGTIFAGTSLRPGEERESWLEVTLEGWIWAPSVQPDGRPGYDLVVSSRGGENLRLAPNGERVARLEYGTLLVQVERQGQWIQVRRTGWIRATGATGADRSRVPKAGAPQAAGNPPTSITPPATGDPAIAAAASDSVSSTGALGLQPGDIAWIGQIPGRILSSPAGDTLATVRPLTAVEVVEQRGDWARVRLEGWVLVPTLGTPSDSGTILSGLAVEVLRSNPDQFQGRLLEWEVQFIALNRAERIRTDLTEGELFILARPPGDQPGFVYITIPEALRARVQELTPLQQIAILARIRTGRSEQMGVPILELIELR